MTRRHFRLSSPAARAAMKEFTRLPEAMQSGIAMKGFEDSLWARRIRLAETQFDHHRALFALVLETTGHDPAGIAHEQRVAAEPSGLHPPTRLSAVASSAVAFLRDFLKGPDSEKLPARANAAGDFTSG